MHADADLKTALNGIQPKKILDQLVRIVTTSTLLGMVSGTVTRIRPDLLFAGGPGLVGGRFTPIGGPEALYVASSEATARAEWENGLTRLYPGVAIPPKTVFYVDVELVRVLDVTLAKNQCLLGTDSKELISEWKGLTLPPTQRLGLAVYESNCFSAIRYRSSRAKRGYCLVIFPDRLRRTEESVGVSDPMNVVLTLDD
jgi:RES domain-containing protein